MLGVEHHLGAVLEALADALLDHPQILVAVDAQSSLGMAPRALADKGNDVNAGLEKTLVIARNIVKNKANIVKDYGEIPEIQCSPSQINQVFLNLITNAAQAIDGFGEIVLKTQTRGSGHVAVSVADNGCGIPAEIMDKIRDPFFTTKEVGAGTGLGLSIVEEIVRSHGGTLEIESEPGEGSVFTVVLPLRNKGASASGSPEETPAATLHEDGDSLAEAV
jgi:signal transduction histidine kinase